MMATKREIDIANAIKKAVIYAWDSTDSRVWDSVADRAAMEAVDVEEIINKMSEEQEIEIAKEIKQALIDALNSTDHKSWNSVEYMYAMKEVVVGVINELDSGGVIESFDKTCYQCSEKFKAYSVYETYCSECTKKLLKRLQLSFKRFY